MMYDGNSLPPVQARILLHHIDTITYRGFPYKSMSGLNCLVSDFIGQSQHSRGSPKNALQDEFHVGLSLQKTSSFLIIIICVGDKSSQRDYPKYRYHLSQAAAVSLKL